MILEGLGDEIRAARIVCIYRRRSRDYLVAIGSRRGTRTIIHGDPARAIVEKPLRYRTQA